RLEPAVDPARIRPDHRRRQPGASDERRRIAGRAVDPNYAGLIPGRVQQDVVKIHLCFLYRPSVSDTTSNLSNRGRGADDLEVHLVLSAGEIPAPSNISVDLSEDLPDLRHLGCGERALLPVRMTRRVIVDRRPGRVTTQVIRIPVSPIRITPVIRLMPVRPNHRLDPSMKLLGHVFEHGVNVSSSDAGSEILPGHDELL